MQEKTYASIKTDFAEDVYKGLTDFPKHLSSKYFYDEQGDKLFQDIMHMPEYYLTDCEFEIFRNHKQEITNRFKEGAQSINIIELGAGDGRKTKILLEHLVDSGTDFSYIPIDISQNALDSLQHSLEAEIPAMEVTPMQGTYFEVLEKLSGYNDRRKVILFLGSNIGNLLHANAVDFLSRLQAVMKDDDLLFIGFDQKKDPQTVLNAYNDPHGITEAFNKNILERINKEFAGDFEVDNFLHWEVYDPETGTAKSYLVSKKEQQVRIKALDLTVNFAAWETIHTEISQKYDDEVVEWLAGKASLSVKAVFSDKNLAYKDYLFKRK